jgi:hypothetical protein
MNLRDLTSDQEAILAQVESGDFTLEDVSDHLELLESERNQKIENYLHVINRLTSEEVTVTAEIDRLQTIRQQKEKALANIKSWLLMSMKDGEKHEFDLFKVSRVKGREVLQLNSTNDMPPKYKTIKQTETIDKRLLLADLKAGAEIKGAEITTGNPSLRIK